MVKKEKKLKVRKNMKIGLACIFVLILGYFVLQPNNETIQIPEEKVQGALVGIRNRYTEIREPEEVEALLEILQELEFRKEHPYKMFLFRMMGEETLVKPVFRIALFQENENWKYSYENGFMLICFGYNDIYIEIEEEQYRLVNSGDGKYKEFIKQYVSDK